LNIWDATTGTPISTITGHWFAVANDFSTVASSKDNIATLYNMNGSSSDTMFTTSSRIVKLALSSESSRVAAGLCDGTVWLWDSGNAELIDRFYGFDGSLEGSLLQFSSTGTRLAYSSPIGIKLQDGTSGRVIADLRCGSWHGFEFSDDGSRIASLSFDGNLTLWNSESGGKIFFRIFRQSRRHTELVQALAFDPDGRLFASGSDDATIKLWNGGDGALRETLKAPGWLKALGWSPDGRRFASESNDGTVDLWDGKGGTLRGTLQYPVKHGWKYALAFDPDGGLFASGSDDGTIKLWNGGDGALRGTLKVFGGLEAVALS
ncbi:hypothetical protein M378DRAFT_47900, partial [Amanita muscaria Koide BX008]